MRSPASGVGGWPTHPGNDHPAEAHRPIPDQLATLEKTMSKRKAMPTLHRPSGRWLALCVVSAVFAGAGCSRDRMQGTAQPQPPPGPAPAMAAPVPAPEADQQDRVGVVHFPTSCTA